MPNILAVIAVTGCEVIEAAWKEQVEAELAELRSEIEKLKAQLGIAAS